MPFMSRLAIAALITLAGCAFEPSGPGDPGPIDPDPDLPLDVDAGVVTPTPPPTSQCRAEGPNLGVVGLLVEVPGQGIYRFDAWQSDNSGDLIGFSLSGPTPVRYQ